MNINLYLYNAIERYADKYPQRLHNRKQTKIYLMTCATNYAQQNPAESWDQDATLRLIETIVEEFCTCV
jgi:hypothetical protein